MGRLAGLVLAVGLLGAAAQGCRTGSSGDSPNHGGVAPPSVGGNTARGESPRGESLRGEIAKPQAPIMAAGRHMVVAGHPEAAAIGNDILASGGSAADAAVAVSLALGVAEPYGSGLGGKLALLHLEAATGEVAAIEALDESSHRFTRSELAEADGKDHLEGWKAVATPGLLAGLWALHQEWGRLPWAQLVTPAAELADRGAEVLPLTRVFFERRIERISVSPEAKEIYLPGGTLPEISQRLPNPDLGKTLREIALKGARGFYEGWVAEAIARASAQHGGYLDLEDLAQYRASRGTPLAVDFEGHRVYSSAPPTSGGATVLLTLAALQGAPWQGSSILEPPNLDLLGRALEDLYPLIQSHVADRSEARFWVEDFLQRSVTAAKGADFGRQPAALDSFASSAVSRLPGSSEGLARRSFAFPATYAPVSKAVDPDGSTTHFVVADRDGNIVSVTQSLSHHFGAGVVAAGTGVVFNNTLHNFSYRDRTSVNLAGPRKRPRTTIAPTLVTTPDRPGELWALGLPGGQRIPTATLQVLLESLVFGHPLEDAIQAPRVHLRRPLDGSPAREFELESPPDGLAGDLAALGWTVTHNTSTEAFGGFCALRRTAEGRVVGIADRRRTNAAAGGE